MTRSVKHIVKIYVDPVPGGIFAWQDTIRNEMRTGENCHAVHTFRENTESTTNDGE